MEARGFITEYSISYETARSSRRQQTTPVVHKAPADSSSTVVDGLDPSADYVVSLSAVTSVGLGPVSPMITPSECALLHLYTQ